MPRWADAFPYVNGGLFSGSMDVPRFSKIARSYLLHIGNLDWTKINPDIFGSMIQAVAEDEERGALGMHYTSVPNILKVLNPLFLDDLRAQLEEAGDNPRMLLNLRKRMARIRVFDPACGSGNFLVIAYKEMRAIEAEINKRRGEAGSALRHSADQLSRHRAARLSGRDRASCARSSPSISATCSIAGRSWRWPSFCRSTSENWITCGNALRLDWLSICPPTGTGVKLQADDLFQHATGPGADRLRERRRRDIYLRESAVSKAATWQTRRTKSGLERTSLPNGITELEDRWTMYAGWFMKAADYAASHNAALCVCGHQFNLPGRAGCRSCGRSIFETRQRNRFRPHFVQMGEPC